MHANGAEEVVYAGEMSIRRKHEHGAMTYTIVLDNNSGTYAPSRNELPLVREVFVRNFASRNVSFEALDREDPKLKEYASTLRAEESVDGLPAVNGCPPMASA
jgi:hypothetical protein